MRTWGKISAWLALVAAILLALAHTYLVTQSAYFWPYFWVDYIAAALLAWGAVRTLKKQRGGLRLLCTAWGFTAGLAWMVSASAIAPGADQPLALVAAKLGLLLAALAGMALTVLHKE